MPYAYAPPRGFAATVALVGAYTAPRGFAVPVRLAPPGDLPAANDESFDTGKHFPLTVVAPGVLANDSDPVGDGLTAVLDDDVAHGALTFNDDGSFHYVPDASFLGVDTFTYYVVDGNGVSSDSATVTINVALLPVQRYERAGAGLPFGLAPRRLRAVSAGFTLAAPVRRSDGAAFAKGPSIARSSGLPITRAARAQRSTSITLDKAPALRSPSVGITTTRAPSVRADAQLAWGKPPAKQASRDIAFDAPPLQSLTARLPFTLPPRKGADAGLPYLHPPVRARSWRLPWSRAPAVQFRTHPRVITPPDPDPDPPQFNPGRGFAIAVALVCPPLTFRGFAIPVPIGPAACYFARPRPRSYIVLNTATVIATLSGHAIAVSDIQISEAIEDTFHSVQLTLADPADLAWLKPTNIDPSPIAIEININGYLRTAIIEDWSTETVYPGKSVTVTGRAITALLDAPFAPTRAYIETADRTSQQLIDRELDSTGYTADYGIIDWSVPAGAWHYDNLSPAAAVREVAAAAGAVARSHPWDKIVEILPRYPVSPWDWSTTSPDKTIVDDFVPRLVDNDGTSGTPTYEVRLPLWPSSETSKPGLIRPGQLVEFAAAAGWKAQVAAVRITASMQQSGNASVLVVWQDITLEAPPAEPRYDYVLVSGQQIGVSDPVIRDGSAGTKRLPQIIDSLITEHAVAAERGRNAIAGGADGLALSNLWAQLVSLQPQGRYVKGNISADLGGGSYAVDTSDGSTIRARALPGQTWSVLDGVFVQDGRIVDSAPSLPGVTQTV